MHSERQINRYNNAAIGPTLSQTFSAIDLTRTGRCIDNTDIYDDARLDDYVQVWTGFHFPKCLPPSTCYIVNHFFLGTPGGGQ